MSQHIDATFTNGVFRPEQPVDIADGERVSLTIETRELADKDLDDVRDLLDSEFIAACRQTIGKAPNLATVRQELSGFHGSLAERISDERDDR